MVHFSLTIYTLLRIIEETSRPCRRLLKNFIAPLCLTGAILYLGCMLVMATVGHSGTVTFFNSLLHGVDISSIIRKSIPLWEAGVGIVETFILSWLVGVCVAGIYNIVFYSSLGKRA